MFKSRDGANKLLDGSSKLPSAKNITIYTYLKLYVYITDIESHSVSLCVYLIKNHNSVIF